MTEPNFQIVLGSAPYHEIMEVLHALERLYPRYKWTEGTATRGRAKGVQAIFGLLQQPPPYPITADVFDYFHKFPRDYPVSIFCQWGQGSFMDETIQRTAH